MGTWSVERACCDGSGGRLGRLEGRGTWLALAGNNWVQDPTRVEFDGLGWAGVFHVGSSSAPAEMVVALLSL